MKTIRRALIGFLSGMAALSLAGERVETSWLNPVDVTFTNVNYTYTNGYRPQGISAIFLQCTVNTGLALRVVHNGSTNLLPDCNVTNTSLFYKDGACGLALFSGDKLIVNTGSTTNDSNKLSIYFKL